jgi:PAS domain S-box-containing protein
MQNISQNPAGKKSEELLKILNEAPIGLLSFNSNWEIDFVNDNFLKFGILYQFTADSIVGLNLLEQNLFPGIDITDELSQLKDGYSFEKEIKNIISPLRGVISLIIKGSPLFSDKIFNGGILLIEDLSVLSETKNFESAKYQYIRSIIRDTVTLLIVASESGDVKYADGKLLELLLPKDYKATGLKLDDLFPVQTNELLKKSIELVQLTNNPIKVNFNLKVNNLEQSFECTLEPLPGKSTELKLISMLFKDLSESVKQQNRFKDEVKEFAYYQKINETINNALFAVDNEGTVIYWDKTCEKLFTLKTEEITGKFFGTKLKLFDQNYFNNITENLKIEKIWKVNLSVFGVGKEKEIYEAQFTRADENTILVLCSNVTDRSNTESKLRNSLEKYLTLVNKASELICVLDTKGLITYTNNKFINTLKFSEEEIFERNFKSLLEPRILELHPFEIKNFDSPALKQVELTLLSKRGKKINCLAEIIPFYSETRLHKGYYCFLTDITEKKEAENNLALFQSVFEAAIDGVAVVWDGNIQRANNSFAEIFGYTSGNELINKDLLDLVSNEDILKVAEYLRLKEKKKDAPGRFEFLGKRKDKSAFYTELSVASFEKEDKVYLVLVARDVTERKRAQKVIRDSEEKYRNLTENIDDFLYTFERIGNTLRPVFYTSAVEKITGYSQAEFLSDSRLMIKIIHPDDISELKKKLRTFIKSKLQASGEFEFRIINKHGNVVWIRNKTNLIRSSSGQIQKLYGLVSDITSRKRAEDELKKSTDNLVKLNETKDKFLSIVSHDLRTPFSSLLGFTDFLLNDEDLTEEEKKQYVRYIQESARSMLSLVNSLLDWTRLQTGRIRFEPQRYKASQIVESTINSLAGAAMQKRIKLSSSVDESHYIFVDKNLIAQVLNNLVSNAIKFSNEKGMITISSGRSENPRFLEFSVKDTGIGIRPENLDKLFNVGAKFTTEGTAGEKGSGLGLSLVQEIINKHGGTIRVISEYGKGSDFRFTLPVASAEILLVDNNNTDRLLYSKIIKNITPNYNVEVVSNGREALERVGESIPALIIIEHQLPEISGYELASQILKSESGNKPSIIILSRKLDRNTIEEYSKLGIEYIFQKPVNLSSFKIAVEKSL